MDQRERLINAAIRCLERRGYARTTTRDIVAEAGVHLPAVNYYFGSKEELLKVAVTQALRRWSTSVLAALDGPAQGVPREELRRGVAAFLTSLDGNRDAVIAGVEAFAQAPRSEDLAGQLAKDYQSARELIAERVSALAPPEQRVAPQDVQGVAAVLLALFDGLAFQWLLGPGLLPDAEQIVRAMELLTGAPPPEQ
jgi:AcrR family transcriptional regulator